MKPRATRPLRKSSSAPPPSRVKRGGAAKKGDGADKAKSDCPFCAFKHFRVLHGNDLAMALRDEYPVSKGHTLIVPRRHVRSWSEATENERLAILELIDRMRERLDEDVQPDGYNIGINEGAAAGQTVLHLHVHLIPRYLGDVPDPRGGVRNVIPERGNYLTIARIIKPDKGRK